MLVRVRVLGRDRDTQFGQIEHAVVVGVVIAHRIEHLAWLDLAVGVATAAISTSDILSKPGRWSRAA